MKDTSVYIMRGAVEVVMNDESIIPRVDRGTLVLGWYNSVGSYSACRFRHEEMVNSAIGLKTFERVFQRS